MHAGIHLEVNRVRSGTEAVCGLSDRIDEPTPIDDRNQRPPDDGIEFLWKRFGEDDDRGVDPCLAKAHAFRHEGDGQMGRAAVEGRFRHGDISMAVCVGLDDGAHNGRGDGITYDPHVRFDRVEVYLDPGRTHGGRVTNIGCLAAPQGIARCGPFDSRADLRLRVRSVGGRNSVGG